MIGSAREAEAGARLEADVCVIGAGAAGISLALALADSARSVLVLESGGLEADAATTDLNVGTSVGRPYFALAGARTRYLGGSTNCWSGMCRKLDPIDLEQRDWVPHSGWPLTHAELEPYYARAAELLHLDPRFGAELWHDGTGAGPLPLPGGSHLASEVLQWVAPRRRPLGTLYRGELERARSVRVLLHANVTRIALAAHGRSVDHLDVAVLQGQRFSVRARTYVLATGGIENPRLLLASNDVAPGGIGNAHDKVGRFFMEHPHVDGEGWLAAGSCMPPHGFYVPHTRARAGRRQRVTGLLRPTDATLRSERLLNFAALLVPTPSDGDVLTEAVARTAAELDGWAHAGACGMSGTARSFTFGVPQEQAPNPDSRVALSPRDTDALGMPRVALDWRLSELDKTTALGAQRLLAEDFARAGYGRVKLTLPDDLTSWPQGMEGGRHHMGTTRMSDDPRRGVTDANARVHGLDDLYVAGSSLFPTSGAANPTLTLVALAIRLADHLREQLV